MARWAAAAALTVALIAAGIFAHRQWVASRALRHSPPAVPPSVQQRSLKFTFSKMDGQQTVFTIHAGRATRYSDQSGSVLEDVDIVVNGEHGERHDEIHTRSCEYEPESGAVVCHGRVELDLSSVPVARPVNLPPSGGIHVATRDVTFNRDTGTATTGAPVRFHFPQGEGSAEGAVYSSRAADFHLQRDVKIRLAAGRAGYAPTVVTAQGGLTFDRRGNRLQLLGPLEIRQGDRLIETGELTVDLNGRLRPERALMDTKTIMRVTQQARRGSLQAQSAEILFDREGRAVQMNASRHVVFTGNGPAAAQIRAQDAAILLNPADGQPRTVNLKGNVRLEEKRPAGILRLSGDSLRLALAPKSAGAKAVRLADATIPDSAQAEWNSADGNLRMASGKMAVVFGADDQVQDLRGSSGVQLYRLQPGHAPLMTTADNLLVNFSGGQWSRVEESGHVRAAQGQHSGNANRAVWVRGENAFELTGKARVSDPSGQLLADTIAWNQQGGGLQATGHVRSSYMAAAGPGIGAAPGPKQPVNIVAEALHANSKTGQAVFSGSARLWTGNLVLQANQIQMQRAKRELIAIGNVRAAFPQVPFRGALAGKGKSAPGAAAPERESKNGGQGSPVLWRVQAQRLVYVTEGQNLPALGHLARSLTPGESGKVTLDGGAQAWSSQSRIEARTLVLHLSRQGNGRIGLTEATASGGVAIRQGDRWGRAENARFDAASGKFVLWGGSPFLRDTAGNLVTGSELTFSEADDTILVESSEGSRTLTRHPVRN